MGDDFELREYQRKTELVCSKNSLNNNYKNVEAGKNGRTTLFQILQQMLRVCLVGAVFFGELYLQNLHRVF